MADRSRHPATAEAGFRQPNDQRHTRRAVVDEVAMEVLAVIAEALSVVARDDQERPLEQVPAFQHLAQPPDQAVRVRNLRVVWPLRIPRRIGLGRLVGIVRLEEMQPQEEGRAERLVEPGLRLLDRLRPLALNGPDVQHPHVLNLELVVVAVEAAIDSPSAVQDEGTDEASGAPAGGGQVLGECR